MSSHISVKSKAPFFTDTTPKRRGRPKKAEPEPKRVKLNPKVQEPQGFSLEPSKALASLPELSEWDHLKLPNGFFVVLEGKRRTGKSTFAKWLLQYYKDKFSLVWVMSQTSGSGYWQKFVGEKYVFPGWRPAAINRLISRNDKIIAKYGEESDIALKTGQALIILDDCINKEIWDSNEFIRLAVEGRHHLICVIFITQDPKTIRPMIRDNADVAVVFNQKTFRNKESLWHDFMNDVDKKTAFELIGTHCVEHAALVCVQTNLNSDIQKNFFVSTGDKTKLEDPEYILGGPSQKEMVTKERLLAKQREQMKKLEAKADRRPDEKKVEPSLTAAAFTVENMNKVRM